MINKAKKIWLIAPVCLFIVLSASWRIAHAQSNHLWISQIQVEGDGGANDEFVEIYNPTDVAVSLDGWSVQYKSSSGGFSRKNLPADAMVGPQDYYLIARSGYNGTVTADHTHSTFSLSGNASGGTVFLVSDSVTLSSGIEPSIVDKVGYGTSVNNSPEGTGTAVPDSEMALLRGNDTDDNSVDFVITTSNPRKSSYVTPVAPPTSPTPAPELQPSPQPESSTTPPAPTAPPPSVYSSDVIISEIFANPDGEDTGEEWIELFNNSAVDVELSGWIIDDEGSGIGKDAYIFAPDSLIKSNSYLIINLLEEHFALNNTGGDTVRIFWPDKTLASQVAYTVTIKADQSFARNAFGTFEPTDLISKGLINQFVQPEISGITSTAQTKIKINEIFPNPKGADSGTEWIELINTGTEPVYIHNWYIDDGEKDSPIGSTAWKIPGSIVNPGGVSVIMIPSGKVSLSNSGNETVRLFNENKILIDYVAYQDSREDLSFALIDDKWAWLKPTPNALNIIEIEATPDAEKVLSEDGKVSGVTSLPRTGRGGGFTMWDGFVFWAIIWYIYTRLSKKGSAEYEQARID